MKIIKNGELVKTKTRIIHKYNTEENNDIFCMSKLTAKKANTALTGKIYGFIYFSEALAGHGPRIKFAGGSAETNTTQNSPAMLLSQNGAESVETQNWMNKKNCPNAFDDKIVNAVADFADKFISLLLLTWFRKLDESDTLLYFQGHLTWQELLSGIINVSDDIYEDIQLCESLDELHEFCLNNKLYRF